MQQIIISLIIAIVLQIIFFIPANKQKTDKFTDLTYGLSFILIALFIIIFNRITYGKILLFAMIFTWALRLILFLTHRIKKTGKDPRFDKIRNNPIKFLSFWLMQGIAVWIIMIPAIFYLSSDRLGFNIFTILGFLIWIAGLIIEEKADQQKSGNKKKDSWVFTGLWKYSRHPNYFGEIMCWLGIYIFTLSTLTGLNAIMGIISPLFIIILLVFVTGIPKLELYYNRKFSASKEYKEYKKRTSILIPWCPKKSRISKKQKIFLKNKEKN